MGHKRYFSEEVSLSTVTRREPLVPSRSGVPTQMGSPFFFPVSLYLPSSPPFFPPSFLPSVLPSSLPPSGPLTPEPSLVLPGPSFEVFYLKPLKDRSPSKVTLKDHPGLLPSDSPLHTLHARADPTPLRLALMERILGPPWTSRVRTHRTSLTIRFSNR